MKKSMLYLILIVVLSILSLSMVAIVTAVPTGPTTEITPLESERLPTWVSQSVTATAGNITEFNTDTSSITRTWQGYFGNITGIIVLADVNNNSMYDWDVAMPQGEIYAVSHQTGDPAWSSVVCSSQVQLQAEDTRLGVDEAIDEDAVNATFVIGGSAEAQANYGATIDHPTFYVASSEILLNTCPVAGLYDDTDIPSDYFREVILSDGASYPIIYTALIAHTLNPTADSTGFDGVTHDFQMIVGEDGHGTDIATSTYWFYLEIE